MIQVTIRRLHLPDRCEHNHEKVFVSDLFTREFISPLAAMREISEWNGQSPEGDCWQYAITGIETNPLRWEHIPKIKV